MKDPVSVPHGSMGRIQTHNHRYERQVGNTKLGTYSATLAFTTVADFLLYKLLKTLGM